MVRIVASRIKLYGLFEFGLGRRNLSQVDQVRRQIGSRRCRIWLQAYSFGQMIVGLGFLGFRSVHHAQQLVDVKTLRDLTHQRL